MDRLGFRSLKGIFTGLAGELTAVSTDLFFSIPERDYVLLPPVDYVALISMMPRWVE